MEFGAEEVKQVKTAFTALKPWIGSGVAVAAVVVFFWTPLMKLASKAKSLVKRKAAPVDLVPEADEIQEGLEWICRFGKAIGAQGLITEALVEKQKRYRVGPAPSVTVTVGGQTQ